MFQLLEEFNAHVLRTDVLETEEWRGHMRGRERDSEDAGKTERITEGRERTGTGYGTVREMR